MSKNRTSETEGELPVLGQPKEPAKRLKSTRGRIRAAVLILVHVVILVHIAHYWYAGRTLSPLEPSEAMYTIELGHVNAGAILFGAAILSTVVFGRFFCGWGCHLIALQDLCSYILRRFGFRPKPLRSRLLIIVPFVLAFYMFCWPTVKRLVLMERHPGLTFDYLMTENFWYTFPGPIVSILTFVVCGGLIVYLLGNKGFCTYGCPYGAFFSVADRVAFGRIRVTDACHQCGQCTANCTSNVQVHAEVRDYGMVVDPGCMKCTDCVSVCPNDALYFSLSERPGARTEKKDTEPVKRRRKNYDFTIGEELVGLLIVAFTVFALRGLYDVVPLLLTVALGVITAYLSIQVWRIFRKRDLRLQNFQLKRNSRITKFGIAAIAFLLIWAAFNIHSSIVQFTRYQGREYLGRISAPWVELLDGIAQPKLTPDDHANIDAAIRSYELTDRIGFMDVLEVKFGLAVASMLKDDLESADKYLREAYECDPPAMREMYAEFLVTHDRQEEAAKLFEGL